jgi:hypothetical protein
VTEKEEVLILANKILDNASLDPDGDLSVLARQLLRREERLQSIIAVVESNPDPEYIAKIARGEAI